MQDPAELSYKTEGINQKENKVNVKAKAFQPRWYNATIDSCESKSKPTMKTANNETLRRYKQTIISPVEYFKTLDLRIPFTKLVKCVLNLLATIKQLFNNRRIL